MFMENPNRRMRITDTENGREINDGVPLDAITEVLLRLPAKSVARFRAVNKHLESISRSPSFINEHLERAKKCSNPSILIMDENSCISLIEFKSWQTTSTVVNDHDGMSTLHSSSCNGLVCLSDTEGRHGMILNPTTRERFMIPKPPNSSNYLFEVGFDSSSEEYKVLRMYPSAEENCTWEVLTVGGTSWRHVGTTPNGEMLARGVYVDGVIYWVVYGEETRLLSFDFKEERLSSIDEIYCEPLNVDGIPHLLEVGGRLGMAITREDMFVMSLDIKTYQLIEIWVMGDATDEWSLDHTLRVPDEEHFHVCFLKERKFLLYNLSDNCHYYYDVETHSYGPKAFELPINVKYCIPHVESLVTLKGR